MVVVALLVLGGSMKPAPTLSAATAEVASSLLRLLRTAPGSSDERIASHRLQTALCTCQFDCGPQAVAKLTQEALGAGWDRHPERAPLRSLMKESVVSAAPVQAKASRWSLFR